MRPEEIKSLADHAQIESDLKALAATTDRHAPQELLALVGQKGDGWEITAITAGKQTQCVPEGPPLSSAAKLKWTIDRACGKRVRPAAVTITEQGWYAYVVGNAVMLESWLHARGYHSAFAGSPTAVWIGALCPGRMRPKAGYDECDACGHIFLTE